MSDFDEHMERLTSDGSITDWVMGKVEKWKDHYEANYQAKHDSYNRMWRGVWAEEDKTRESERSRLVAPALRQAVESGVADVEQATFGQKFFDIKDDPADQDPMDVMKLRISLERDLKAAKVRPAVGEALIVGAVYGTGIGEINLEERKTATPATRPTMDGLAKEVGTQDNYRILQTLTPIQPRNFFIDPLATCIDDAMGCGTDQYVSLHDIEMKQDAGVYRDDAVIGSAAETVELEKDPLISSLPDDKARVTRYYGLVPTKMLEELEWVDNDDLTDDLYTEAIVVIANGGEILKAIPNPYMSEYRPIVAFSWDVVPGSFWGCGLCEKGYSSQKALDAEIRARIDALALTTHPMMAANSEMMPRGAKLAVRPGRTVMTNGDPRSALMPLKFGDVNQITFAQAAELQKMVQQATGTSDAGMAQAGAAGDARTGAVSIAMGTIVKRQMRTLCNFQEQFLIPMLRKMTYGYMQFNPEDYPAKDYEFIIDASLGVVAREYEIGQLSQVLNSLPPGPAQNAILTGIVNHMNVSNREEILRGIEAGNQPNPEAQELEKQNQQLQFQLLQAQSNLLNAQAQESQSRANKYNTEAELAPQEMMLEYQDVDKDGAVDKEFDRKMQIAELELKRMQVEAQNFQKNESAKAKAEAELIRRLTGE
jgi:hypothetical protein